MNEQTPLTGNQINDEQVSGPDKFMAGMFLVGFLLFAAIILGDLIAGLIR